MFAYFSSDADIQQISHCHQPMPLGIAFHRHFHTNYELLLVIKGDVHYNIDGQQYALKPYDLLFIPASTYHFAIPMSNMSYENYVLNFNQEFIQKANLQFLFDKPRILNIYTDMYLHRMFGLFDLYHQLYTKEDFDTAASHLLNELLLYTSYKFKACGEAILSTEAHPLISRITAYIAENLQSDLNSDVIARDLNFSKSYIQNTFSVDMEIGLQQYINQKKIHAAHYDIQKGLPPGEAAAKYGYRNYSSFYRQYKKFFGHSPKAAKL